MQGCDEGLEWGGEEGGEWTRGGWRGGRGGNAKGEGTRGVRGWEEDGMIGEMVERDEGMRL